MTTVAFPAGAGCLAVLGEPLLAAGFLSAPVE